MNADRPSAIKVALVALAASYMIGLIIAVVVVGPIYLFKGHPPEWTWWQYLLAPLAFGLVQLAGEWLFEKPANKFHAWHRTISQRAKAGFLILLLGGIVAFMAIYTLLQT